MFWNKSKKKCVLCENDYIEKNKNATNYICPSCMSKIIGEENFKDIIKETKKLSKKPKIHNKNNSEHVYTPKVNEIIINEIHWKYFLNGNTVISCETKQEANEFLYYCNSKGLKWKNENSLIENEYREGKYWNVNKKEISFRYNKKRNGLDYSNRIFHKNLYTVKYNVIKIKNILRDIKINEGDWKGFLNLGILVNCETEQEAKEFCLYCHKKGYKWFFDDQGDDILINNSRWDIYKEKSCYSPYLTGICVLNSDNIMKEYKDTITKYKEIINRGG